MSDGKALGLFLCFLLPPPAPGHPSSTSAEGGKGWGGWGFTQQMQTPFLTCETALGRHPAHAALPPTPEFPSFTSHRHHPKFSPQPQLLSDASAERSRKDSGASGWCTEGIRPHLTHPKGAITTDTFPYLQKKCPIFQVW